jgi:hypothetical protein
MRSATFLMLALAGSSLLSAGCPQNSDSPSPQPVRGTVLFQGKPIEGALVTFFPTEAKPGYRSLTGMTDAKGRFRLAFNRSNDGAPVGKYKVSVVWREMIQDGDEKLPNGPNRLPERYADPDASGLTATIVEGKNDLPPFDLDDK